MANIKIDWTNPSDVTGVAGVRLLKKTVADENDPAPSCSDFIAVNAVPTTDRPAGVDQCYDYPYAPTANSAGTYLDEGVTAGNYYYAVFTYNEAGFSPCASTTTVTTIT
jgi:hypothetical protein